MAAAASRTGGLDLRQPPKASAEGDHRHEGTRVRPRRQWPSLGAGPRPRGRRAARPAKPSPACPTSPARDLSSPLPSKRSPAGSRSSTRCERAASREPKETKNFAGSTPVAGDPAIVRPRSSPTAREQPNQTAASARAKVVEAMPCPTDAQFAAVTDRGGLPAEKQNDQDREDRRLGQRGQEPAISLQGGDRRQSRRPARARLCGRPWRRWIRRGRRRVPSARPGVEPPGPPAFRNRGYPSR